MSVIVVITWLAAIGTAEWFDAVAESEPPAWDAFTYAQKASNFWDAISHGKVMGLFDLQPTIRPPGTVLMSYPFGFSNFYGAYYFRSVFIPLVLVIVAVYIVGYFRDTPARTKWLLAALAITVGGMPFMFQFQGNGDIPSAVTWGLVDGFLAGVGAVAIGSARRSVTSVSPWWALGSSLAAAFCLLIKPAGLLVMAIVAASWVILISFRVRWRFSRLWRDLELRRLCLVWLIGTAVIYGLTIASAFFSQYMGDANVTFGVTALAVLQQDFSVPVNVDNLERFFHVSLGYPIIVLAGVGLASSACTRGERGAAAVAALCGATGMWFWIVETGISQVRYFVPFGVMTFIVLVPSLLSLMQRLPAWLGFISAAASMLATAAITLLLIVPRPAESWQRSLGVNLSSGVFRAEDEQALQLLTTLQNEGTKAASIYFADLSSPARSFGAIVNYATFVNSALPRLSIKWPVTWQSPTTFRLSDVTTADYLAFIPTHDAAQEKLSLESRTVPDLAAEDLLMKAWFSSLTPNDGVEVISETRLRLLRITDRNRVEQAIKKLRGAHDWRAVFLAANPEQVSAPTGKHADYGGAVDTVACGAIGGWVWDSADANESIYVVIRVDGQPIGTVPATNSRPDLRMGTGNYGFVVSVPSAFKDGKEHSVSAQVSGAGDDIKVWEKIKPSFRCES